MRLNRLAKQATKTETVKSNSKLPADVRFWHFADMESALKKCLLLRPIRTLMMQTLMSASEPIADLANFLGSCSIPEGLTEKVGFEAPLTASDSPQSSSASRGRAWKRQAAPPRAKRDRLRIHAAHHLRARFPKAFRRYAAFPPDQARGRARS